MGRNEHPAGRIRLPDGRIAEATGWVAELEPAPNRSGRVTLLVSRPADGDPTRYRVVREDNPDRADRAVFPIRDAELAADRIAAGRIDDIIRIRPAGRRRSRPRTDSRLRVETLDERAGDIIRLPVRRAADRIRYRRERTGGDYRRPGRRGDRRGIRRAIRQTRRGMFGVRPTGGSAGDDMTGNEPDRAGTGG